MNNAVNNCSTVQSCRALFETIANDLHDEGFSIKPFSLPLDIAIALQSKAKTIEKALISGAGVGREHNFSHNQFIRTDSIHWIQGNCEAECAWLKWAESLRVYLNQRLLLGLFSFESHFAWYQKGQFYKRHFDAFKGSKNRILSIVVHLNDDWKTSDGGELVLYKNKLDEVGVKILPGFANLVVFLSEEFPHEVLPSNKERLSVAGWFRLNQSANGHIDPPQ